MLLQEAFKTVIKEFEHQEKAMPTGHQIKESQSGNTNDEWGVDFKMGSFIKGYNILSSYKR